MPDRTAAQFQSQAMALIRRQDPEAALALIDQGLTAYPNTPDLNRAKITALNRLGGTEAALSFARSIPAAQYLGQLLPQLVGLCLVEGRVIDARTLLQEAEADGARTRFTVLARIAYLERTSSPRAALEFIDSDTDAFREDALLVIQHSRLLRETGALDAAADVLRTAFDRSGNLQIAELLANLELDRDNPEGADSLLQAAPDLMATTPSWFVHAIRLAERLHGLDIALARTEAGLAVFPTSPILQSYRWRILTRLQRRKDAEAACAAFVAASGDDVDALMRAAQFLQQIRATDACDPVLDDLVRRAPRNPAAMRVVATILLERADALAAKAALSRLSEADRAAADTALLLARINAGLGDTPAARANLLAVIRTDPDHLMARFQLARLYADQGEDAAAEALVAAFPLTPPAHQNRRHQVLFKIAFNQARYSDCLTHLDAILDIDPAAVEALRQKADCQLILGDLAGAWATHSEGCRVAALKDLSGRTSAKLRNSSLRGRVLNEFRLLSDPVALDHSRADADQDAALRVFRDLLIAAPGQTPHAFGLLGALRRTGRILDAPAPISARQTDHAIPKIVHQYWDKTPAPDQIAWLIAQNKAMNPDYDFRLFDRLQARDYLRDKDETAALAGHRTAHNPAIESDIFRLAVLWHEGGVYLDADDRCIAPLDRLIDHRLRFVGYQEAPRNIGNDFIAVRPHDPIIRCALDMASTAFRESLGEVAWLATGPGALSRALVLQGTTEAGHLQQGIWIMPEYRLKRFISSHLRLNYKDSARHWVNELRRQD